VCSSDLAVTINETGGRKKPPTLRNRKLWLTFQIGLWIGGVALLGTMFMSPEIGLHLLWHILIPVAPLLFVFAPGLWRNICPLAFASLLPWQLGLSRRRKLSQSSQGKMYLGAVLLLFTIVPLRHVFLNSSGPGAAIAIIAIGVLATLAGVLFERKSGWCAGLCPIYPVESLYGARPLVTMPNAHCTQCYKCAQPCPERRLGTDSTHVGLTVYHRLAGTIMTGGFAGFVWGWFQTPDYDGVSRLQTALDSFTFCLLGFSASMALFLCLRSIVPARRQPSLNQVFACAAISIYYWYALPTMVGFGAHTSAAIVDLSGYLPRASVWPMRVLPVFVFAWWFVCRTTDGNRAWMAPVPAAKIMRHSQTSVI